MREEITECDRACLAKLLDECWGALNGRSRVSDLPGRETCLDFAPVTPRRDRKSIELVWMQHDAGGLTKPHLGYRGERRGGQPLSEMPGEALDDFRLLVRTLSHSPPASLHDLHDNLAYHCPHVVSRRCDDCAMPPDLGK
jgi:hypothetical protein